MGYLSKSYCIRFSDEQCSTLEKLKRYNINVNHFIRQAIKEKIQRDYKSIKQQLIECPF